MADELDWLEMLVASERVEKWLGTICSSGASTAVKYVSLTPPDCLRNTFVANVKLL